MGDGRGFFELMGQEFTGVKGKEAIDKLMAERRGHVNGAFYHPEIGEIDIFWGDGKSGLSHIIERRKQDGVNPTVFLSSIISVMENGEVFKNSKYPDRINIAHKGKVAVIAFELRGIEVTALLTAFDTKK